MHIICPREELQKGVSIVSKAVSNKTTMPILECILIQTKEGRILMTANDMELGIETEIHGIIEDNGHIAIDAKIFSEIVRRLPDNDISIETDGTDSVKIQCEKINFTIPGKNADEFTFLPEVERLNCVTLSQFTLKEIIRQTIFSISDNENNKMMAGELLEINGNNLRIVSLDGHRISIRKIVLKDSYDSIKVVVPGKTLNEVSKIISGGTDDEVRLYFTENHVMFEFDDTIVVSRLIEGEYFRIDQMLNSDYDTKLTVNKKEMLSCIDRTTMLIKDSDKKPIIISITDHSMEVKLNSAYGSMKEELAIDKRGKDIMIGFNPKFLIDALRVIDDEMINIYMINPKAPCFIRNDEGTYIYLILPVNFNVY